MAVRTIINELVKNSLITVESLYLRLNEQGGVKVPSISGLGIAEADSSFQQ